jgi:glycosyltransferase involved in cell wall biosynthesis
LPKVLPQALHCFEGSALRSFARARQLNIPRVLDVASDHTGYLQVLQQERQALRDSGLLHRAKRKDEAVHSEVYAERALADYLLVPSECVRQALLADGVPDHKIVMMPYGVDTSHFVPTAAPRPATKPFTVLFVGTLLLGKGLQYLLRAWAELGLDDAVLLIVGGDGERLAESLRVSCGRNVEWAGNVSSSQMLAYYHRADVFVFPSLSDAFGLVVAEAMACGLPVITTSTAGASSIILDGINGYIVPPRDVSALKEKIAAFHCDEAMRRRMGQQARGRVVQSYTWEHYEQRLAAFYRTVVLGDTAKSICGENVALVTAL